jgi:hypothetical protein
MVAWEALSNSHELGNHLSMCIKTVGNSGKLPQIPNISTYRTQTDLQPAARQEKEHWQPHITLPTCVLLCNKHFMTKTLTQNYKDQAVDVPSGNNHCLLESLRQHVNMLYGKMNALNSEVRGIYVYHYVLGA